jgi:hypothetical protein
MIPKEKWGVHKMHCCSKHGCKYGDRDCPVVNHLIDQEYPCADCSEEKDSFGYPVKIEIIKESTKVYANGVLIGMFEEHNDTIKIFKPIESFSMNFQQHFFSNEQDLSYYLQFMLEQIRKIF